MSRSNVALKPKTKMRDAMRSPFRTKHNLSKICRGDVTIVIITSHCQTQKSTIICLFHASCLIIMCKDQRENVLMEEWLSSKKKNSKIL